MAGASSERGGLDMLMMSPDDRDDAQGGLVRRMRHVSPVLGWVGLGWVVAVLTHFEVE